MMPTANTPAERDSLEALRAELAREKERTRELVRAVQRLEALQASGRDSMTLARLSGPIADLLTRRAAQLQTLLGAPAGVSAAQIAQASQQLAVALAGPADDQTAEIADALHAMAFGDQPAPEWWQTDLGGAIARHRRDPHPETPIPIGDAARMLGLSMQRVHQLAASGILQRPARGVLTRGSVMRRLAETTRARAGAQSRRPAPAQPARPQVADLDLDTIRDDPDAAQQAVDSLPRSIFHAVAALLTLDAAGHTPATTTAVYEQIPARHVNPHAPRPDNAVASALGRSIKRGLVERVGPGRWKPTKLALALQPAFQARLERRESGTMSARV